MGNFMFYSHYWIPSIYASFTQANKMTVIHILYLFYNAFVDVLPDDT
jgi:hypothetical protein